MTTRATEVSVDDVDHAAAALAEIDHAAAALAEIDQAAAALAAGDLVAFPTETVYGLGARADLDEAVAKIFAAKGRPADHPLIVHLAEPGDAARFAADWPASARRLTARFWPGPLTVIVPRRPEIAAAAAGGQDSIGLRCPAHPLAQALLAAARQAGVPGVAAPSANRFGRISPTCAGHVAAEFGPSIPVLDGGPCALGIESAIVDCTRAEPVLLRPGTLGRAALEQVLGQPLRERDDAAPRASGTLEAHYAPRARLRLMPAAALRTALGVLAEAAAGLDAAPNSVLGPRSAGVNPVAVYSRTLDPPASAMQPWRRMPDDAAAAAQDLFAALRALDASGARLIWVETPPATPEWEGVRDRLQRAAAA